MTENVKSVEKPDMCGATVSVAYADDACWTPRKDAFQVEIGFVQGTTSDTFYQSRFRLGLMPPSCTHLILYLVNVVGTGRCLFRDITRLIRKIGEGIGVTETDITIGFPFTVEVSFSISEHNIPK